MSDNEYAGLFIPNNVTNEAQGLMIDFYVLCNANTEISINNGINESLVGDQFYGIDKPKRIKSIKIATPTSGTMYVSLY